jgi:formamidopyrimidine-DNA glycosylase
MPELPEVETVARALRPNLIGRRMIGVRNTWPRHIDRPDLAELLARIQGSEITGVSRRGKFLLFPLDSGDTLIVHLRMSGHLSVTDSSEKADKHTHTVFLLDDGHELRFRDTRKFGRVYLVDNLDEVVGKLGPEPLDDAFTADALHELIGGRKRVLKPLLLDQAFIAGIGNIYADEALFYAGLHPQRRSDTLSADDVARLHKAIQEVLQLGIEREGASISSYRKPDGEKGSMQGDVAVFRRTGESCYNCGSPIQRIVLGGRSTHFCPSCQK